MDRKTLVWITWIALCFQRLSTSIALAGSSERSFPRYRDPFCQRQKPHIVIILADDMGWNDVSFHGSNQIPTPNVDALAFNGVILNQHYVSALCTPSRSALMTGKNPIHIGMQHSVILPFEPRGLPLGEKLLPEYLRDAGYKTHAVGKWHLGFHKREYTPLFRGFDSHFGYYNGLQDYYTHFVREPEPECEDFFGFDMRRNLSVAWDTRGKYSTDLFTEEAVRLINAHDSKEPMFLYLAHLAPHSGNPENLLQAPDEEVAKFSYITDPERRIYAAMVSKLDQSVGEVVAALRNRGMLENSIILFMSDNGAPTEGMLSNRGSNYPLRGIKNSPWEGAVRGVAAIWSPLIKKSKRVSDQPFYIADWLPTLLSAAGVSKEELKDIDGYDLWPTLVSDRMSLRSEIVINIDDISNYAAIRRGDFKYVIGETSTGRAWLGTSGRDFSEGIPPEYDTSKILHSKTGIAIAGVITAKQVMEARRKREKINEETPSGDKLEEKSKLLSPDEILQLRKEAEIQCNVKEDDKISCDPLKAPCLFNIAKDPCEMVNLAESRPLIVHALEQSLMKHRIGMIPPSNVDGDPRSNPIYWNNTWTFWNDYDPLADALVTEESSQPYSRSILMTMSFFCGILLLGAMLVLITKHTKSIVTKEERCYCNQSNQNDRTNVSENLNHWKVSFVKSQGSQDQSVTLDDRVVRNLN